jgi:hypothetical protein
MITALAGAIAIETAKPAVRPKIELAGDQVTIGVPADMATSIVGRILTALGGAGNLVLSTP